MRYQVIDCGEVIYTAKNRRELLEYIQGQHKPMFYCTNGAHNYSCRTLVDIFNTIEKENDNECLHIVINK